MTFLKRIFLFFSLFALSACAHTISYPLDKASPISPQPSSPSTLKVNPFVDKRPLEEKRDEPYIDRAGLQYRMNNPKGYVEKEIERGITQMVAAHFKKAGLFKEVLLSDKFLESDATRAAGLSAASDEKTDLILQGDILHYVSYVEASPTREFTFGFISGFTFGIGGLLIALPVESSISKQTEVLVALQVEIVAGQTGESLFKNVIERSVNKDQRGLINPYTLADEALKDLVTQLVERLSHRPLVRSGEAVPVQEMSQ
jgi:curli biogenesis system outer membrane secretion channel CsgG